MAERERRRRAQDRLPRRDDGARRGRHIAAQIRGQQPTREENFASIPAVCIMDAGNNGVVILADHMLPPRKHGVMIPGPQSHAAKLAFEKYFLWKSRKGYVKLPSRGPRHPRWRWARVPRPAGPGLASSRPSGDRTRTGRTVGSKRLCAIADSCG